MLSTKMTCSTIFSTALTCWGQALLLEAFLKAEENNDLRFFSPERMPAEWGPCDEPPVGVEQTVSSPGNTFVHPIYRFLLVDT